MNLNGVKYFVFCSGKTGTTTLVKSFKKKFGDQTTLHVHSQEEFNKTHPNNGLIKNLIENNSKNFNKIFIIDSYREPIERSIASFFNNIKYHYPNWDKLSTDQLINIFNEKKFYLLDRYHSYHESWGYFNISTDIDFDFEKGYVLREYENIVFIKTRLKESYRWGQIFSDILGENISFGYDNNSNDKPYSQTYKKFKEIYELPKEVKEEFINCYINKDPKSPFYRTCGEMKKFMTKEEIDEYFNKWCY